MSAADLATWTHHELRDEIERLRSRERTLQDMCSVVGEQAAEIERLKAALYRARLEVLTAESCEAADKIERLRRALEPTIGWLEYAYRNVDSVTASKVKAHIALLRELTAENGDCPYNVGDDLSYYLGPEAKQATYEQCLELHRIVTEATDKRQSLTAGKSDTPGTAQNKPQSDQGAE